MDDFLQSLADEIFGPASDDIGSPQVLQMLDLLRSEGVTGVCFFDSDGQQVAASHRTPDWKPVLFVQEDTSSPLQEELPTGEWLVTYPLGPGGNPGALQVLLQRTDATSAWIAPPWLLCWGEAYLRHCQLEQRQRRDAEELAQLRTEQAVMQEEHRHLLLANLREHNARLEEQSQHLQALERQVEERTRDLTTASEEIAARNRELEEANDLLEMQIRRRQQTEQALRESVREAKRLAVVAAKTGNQVAILDAKGRIDWINDSFATTSGYSIEECIGRDPFTLLSGAKTSQETVAYIRERMQHAKLTKVDVLQYTRQGRHFWNAIEVQPVFNDSGQVGSFILIASDVTQEHETARLLKEARDEAERTAAMKAEFLANMSHEVRSPLTAILGHADILIHEEAAAASSPQRTRSLAAIKRNGTHLLSVVNDILDFSKFEGSEVTLEAVECKLDPFLRGAIQSMQPKADEKGIPLRVTFANPVPATIATDPTRLSQILLNLLSNAIKFTKVGEVSLTVRYLQSATTKSLQFTIRDSGIGMTPEQTRRLFTPFYQADPSTTRQFGGTGLGLSITKRLVDLFAGTINVDSAADIGTTFTVTIPVQVDAQTPLLSQYLERHSEADSTIASPFEKHYASTIDAHILLAEDRPENQELIEHVLTRSGAQVTIVDNGAAVLEKVARSPEEFPVILLDMQMPILDGYQCAKQLRENAFEGVIIALTAHATPQDEKKCLAAGCDFYLSKPIDWNKLFGLIRKTLDLYVCGTAQPRKQERFEDPVIDWSVLLQSSAIDESFATSLISRFSRRLIDDLASLRDACQEERFAEAEQLAHALKGTAGTLGLVGIQNAARDLETSLHQREYAKATAEVPSLEQEALRLQQELERKESEAIVADLRR